MNKFNNIGMEVLDYKSEYLKDYPKLVLDSLNLAITSKCAEYGLPEGIKSQLLDNNVKFETFKKHLLQESVCLKTYEELLVEYENIKNSIDLKLVESEYCKNLKTMSKVEDETIEVVKPFTISEEFIKQYFNIETDKEFEVLMSRKGFIEKFAILRLVKIFKDFIQTQNETDFSITNTLVYFDSEENVYGIHLKFTIPIDLFEDENKMEEISNKIIEISKQSEDNFNNKMQC